MSLDISNHNESSNVLTDLTVASIPYQNMLSPSLYALVQVRIYLFPFIIGGLWNSFSLFFNKVDGFEQLETS